MSGIALFVVGLIVAVICFALLVWLGVKSKLTTGSTIVLFVFLVAGGAAAFIGFVQYGISLAKGG